MPHADGSRWADRGPNGGQNGNNGMIGGNGGVQHSDGTPHANGSRWGDRGPNGGQNSSNGNDRWPMAASNGDAERFPHQRRRRRQTARKAIADAEAWPDDDPKQHVARMHTHRLNIAQGAEADAVGNSRKDSQRHSTREKDKSELS